MTLSKQEDFTAACALRIAVLQYKADADAFRCDGLPRMEEQFNRQADEARTLADKLEGVTRES